MDLVEQTGIQRPRIKYNATINLDERQQNNKHACKIILDLIHSSNKSIMLLNTTSDKNSWPSLLEARGGRCLNVTVARFKRPTKPSSSIVLCRVSRKSRRSTANTNCLARPSIPKIQLLGSSILSVMSNVKISF